MKLVSSQPKAMPKEVKNIGNYQSWALAVILSFYEMKKRLFCIFS